MADQNEQDYSDLIQQMAALGISPEALGLISHQMGRGEQMADTPSAQGMQAGGTYVAASPLEHLATAVRRGIGQSDMAKAQAAYGSQLQQNKAGLAAGGMAQNSYMQSMIDALRKRAQGQPGAAEQGIQPLTAPQMIE